MNYGFIGLGSMSTAIIKGMFSNKAFDAHKIYGINRSIEKTQKLQQAYNVQPTNSISELMDQCDVVVLGVKPQNLLDILPEVRAHLRPSHIIVSIAAGKTLSFFSEQLNGHASIFRVMPNINAVVGASTSCFSTEVTDPQKITIVREMFATIGSIEQLPEDLFSIFTTIGCASPAFTYLYIDSLARAAVRDGMSKEMALKIAASSVLGSAKMVLESDEHPWALIDQVCSPGGTTIQGVTSLQVNHFESTIYDAVAAVTNKDLALK